MNELALNPVPEAEQDALATLKSRFPVAPDVAIILGSGLGGLADSAENPVSIQTSEIPGYPVGTVLGHAGRWVGGTIEDKNVLFVQGRVHLYEGYSISQVTMPIRLLHGLGVKRVIITNAAGGINLRFRAGMIMLITDHLNLAFTSPLSGPNPGPGPRFLDMSEPYDASWAQETARYALESGVALEQGTYLWTLGPSYETKAEIRFFRHIGADAVGMSTVPEVIQARYYDMRVLGLSMISNLATDLQGAPLDHSEVMEMGKTVGSRMETLVRRVVSNV